MDESSDHYKVQPMTCVGGFDNRSQRNQQCYASLINITAPVIIIYVPSSTVGVVHDHAHRYEQDVDREIVEHSCGVGIPAIPATVVIPSHT